MTILARSGAEAARMIGEGSYDGILMDVPQEMQHIVDRARSGFDPAWTEEAVGQLLGTLSGSWLYRNGPLLECLSLVDGPLTPVICVGDMQGEMMTLEDKMSISLLEYRSLSTRISIPEWRSSIAQSCSNTGKAIRRLADRVLSILRAGGKWLCLAGVQARMLDQMLTWEGHNCETILLGRPYLGTPLEALGAELSEGNPTDDRVAYLVRLHLEFIRDYVMVSESVDEAYDRWLREGQWAKLYHQGLR